ncbi:MAG: hypothetical protein H8E12_16500 [Rhodobacteraceae bacterium]|nr:hypothetical protein [Paracoccaceae bacterium]
MAMLKDTSFSYSNYLQRHHYFKVTDGGEIGNLRRYSGQRQRNIIPPTGRMNPWVDFT